MCNRNGLPSISLTSMLPGRSDWLEANDGHHIPIKRGKTKQSRTLLCLQISKKNLIINFPVHACEITPVLVLNSKRLCMILVEGPLILKPLDHLTSLLDFVLNKGITLFTWTFFLFL